MVVMQLEELFNYKNQLMKDLLTNKKIVKLLNDSNNASSNPSTLAYSQVFPYEYVPETIEHGQTFICFDVDIQKSINKTYLLPTIYIWIFSHKSKLRLPEGGLRVDQIAIEIAKTINGSRCYGLGELDLYSVKRFSPLIDYNGKMITLQATDFNRIAPSNKQIPSVRKKTV